MLLKIMKMTSVTAFKEGCDVQNRFKAGIAIVTCSLL
jgi:hypothetical protein